MSDTLRLHRLRILSLQVGKKKSKMCFHLLNATFAQLQHGQVVVSFSVVVIKRQRKFETLIGQRQVCYAL